MEVATYPVQSGGDFELSRNATIGAPFMRSEIAQDGQAKLVFGDDRRNLAQGIRISGDRFHVGSIA